LKWSAESFYSYSMLMHSLRIPEDRHVQEGMRGGHLVDFLLTNHDVIGPLMRPNAGGYASPASELQPPQY
jgi:hypothetical protein